MVTEALKEKILSLVFPDLRYGGDPDVERYFELRRDKRMSEALSLYFGKLKPRYPDDGKRIALLQMYRTRDPQYAEFLSSLLMETALKILGSLRYNIDRIVGPIVRVDFKNTYSVLKAVELIVGFLPSDPDEAVAYMERYASFSRVIDYKRELVSKAHLLVEDYLSASRGAVDESYDFVAKAREKQEARKAKVAKSSFFDLSRISFSKDDIAAIEIPASLSSKEDKVLAYCWKYWDKASDHGFERLVYLYSRKYKTQHFDVLRAIKVGRSRRFTDDEILNLVSTILSSRYSYSVQGDLYMQRAWRQIRTGMFEAAKSERLAFASFASESGRGAPPVEAREAVEGDTSGRKGGERPMEERGGEGAKPARRIPPAGIKMDSREEQARLKRDLLDGQRERARLEREKVLAEREAMRRRIEERNAERDAERSNTLALAAAKARAEALAKANDKREADANVRAEADKAKREKEEFLLATRKAAARDSGEEKIARDPGRASESGKRASIKDTIQGSPSDRSAPYSGRSAGSSGGAKLVAAKARKPLAAADGREEAVPLVRSGSVSDRIKRLSGRSYDVYRELFLSKVGDSIRTQLLESQSRGHGIFDTDGTRAEQLVHAFLKENYDNPYMDWAGSDAKAKVAKLGFELGYLEPIIDHCFGKL